MTPREKKRPLILTLFIIVRKMLPVGVVLCMPGQHWVFPPPTAIIPARSHGMLDIRRCKCSTWISAHLSSRAWRSSPRFWGRLFTHGPIHPKHVLWVCSLAILQAAPSWWRCLLNEIRDYPSTVRCGVIVLVAVVIPEMLPGKWH